MAQLNFPDPNTTQTYTEAGITWTWNATLGVWSAEGGADGTEGGGAGNGASAWANIAPDGTLTNGYNIKATGRKAGQPAGWYYVEFENPMPDTNYAVTFGTQAPISGYVDATKTVNGFEYTTVDIGPVFQDFYAGIAVFATNAAPPKGGTGADAWALTQNDGSVQSSFNFPGTNVRTAQGTYQYTFTTPMPTADYAVVSTANTSTTRIPRARQLTTTGFLLEYTTPGGTGNPILSDTPHSVVVHATNAQLPDTVTQEEINTILDLAENPPTGGPAAWGVINGVSATLTAGLNCSVARTPGEAVGKYTVTFDTPMPNAGYAVTSSISGGGGQRLGINNQTGNGFQANIQSQGGNPIDAGVEFAVHATNAAPPKGGTGADCWVKTSADGNVLGNFNIKDAAVNKRTAAGTYAYEFTTPMPTADYAVVLTGFAGNGVRNSVISDQTATGFTATIYNASSNTPTDTQHYAVVHATNATLPETISKEQIDALEARPTCSAWCISQADSNLVREFNIASCAKGGGPGIYIYTFKEPMPDIQYSVQVTPSNSSQVIFCTNTARSETGFTVRVYKPDGTGQDSGHMVLIHGYN